MKKILLICLFLLPMNAVAAVVQGFLDINGKPLHTRDEFDLNVTAQVSKTPQGFRYTYTLTSLPTSIQSINSFALIISPNYIAPNTSTAPIGIWHKFEPQSSTSFSKMAWVTSSKPTNPDLITPGQQISGFSFVSSYPPGIAVGYATGANVFPAADPNWPDTPQGLPEYDGLTPYGPGKVFPVIGPVKPITPNVTDNYSVLGCTGGLCDVQLDITGPQDPYGNVYTYQWTGAFGTATGAKPVVQLAAGNYNVSVSVSDPYATLVTATMPVTVVDPNPPVVTPPAGGNNGGGNAGGAGQGGTNGGNNGGGNNQGGTGGTTGGANGGNGQNGNTGNPNSDIDHDGIPNSEDDDRDGDGKPNDQDNDPDHPD